jgi:hypothetical protein
MSSEKREVQRQRLQSGKPATPPELLINNAYIKLREEWYVRTYR